MPSESDNKYYRSNYSRERDRDRKEFRRNRSREKERDTNDRKRYRSRSRSRSRDRNRNRDRDRERDRERDKNRERERNRERDTEKNKRENENNERNTNNRGNKNDNDYRAKKSRIENINNSKSAISESKNDNKSKEGEEKKKIEKEKPNYQLTGKLAADANTYNGVVLKYSEPPEARKTKVKWRFHIFKGETQLEPLPVYRQSGYLLGRDRQVADIPIDHPSCSKQHAALQYRQVQGTDENGEPAMVVKPYLIDLNSSNGTFINGEKLEPSRYYELKQGDVVKFGFSTRDYIFIDEDSV